MSGDGTTGRGPSVPELRLVCLRTRQQWPLTTLVTLGRSSRCKIRLTEPSVSREHARAWPVTGGAWIEDLGSANGSAIDGRKLSNASRFAPIGAQIQLGREWLILEAGAVPQPSLPGPRRALLGAAVAASALLLLLLGTLVFVRTRAGDQSPLRVTDPAATDRSDPREQAIRSALGRGALTEALEAARAWAAADPLNGDARALLTEVQTESDARAAFELSRRRREADDPMGALRALQAVPPQSAKLGEARDLAAQLAAPLARQRAAACLGSLPSAAACREAFELTCPGAGPDTARLVARLRELQPQTLSPPDCPPEMTFLLAQKSPSGDVWEQLYPDPLCRRVAQTASEGALAEALRLLAAKPNACAGPLSARLRDLQSRLQQSANPDAKARPEEAAAARAALLSDLDALVPRGQPSSLRDRLTSPPGGR